MINKIAIFGGTGFIGSKLVSKLKSLDYHVISFSRNLNKSKENLPNADEHVVWGYDDKSWYTKLEDIKAVVNLSGATIAGKRWSEDYKKVIYNSRIKSTELLVETIKQLEKMPEVLINASAVGYYGNTGDKEITEESNSGTDFLSVVCKDWEEAAHKLNHNSRVVALRIGVVLDEKGGALAKMLLPFKLFVGGPIGNGKQYLPWIHIDDLVNMIVFSIEDEKVEGAINGTAPNPIAINEFAMTLGKVLRRPSIFKVPKFVLKMLMGEQSQIILEGQKAIPRKALENGFEFIYSDLEPSLRNLLAGKD